MLLLMEARIAGDRSRGRPRRTAGSGGVAVGDAVGRLLIRADHPVGVHDTAEVRRNGCGGFSGGWLGVPKPVDALMTIRPDRPRAGEVRCLRRAQGGDSDYGGGGLRFVESNHAPLVCRPF